MEKILRAFLYVLVCAVAVSCGGGDEPEPDPGPNPPVPSDPVSRTVLVYMVADNTLGTIYDCDRLDLKEMADAAVASGFNGGRLLVYYGRPRTSEGLPPQMLEITARGEVTLKTYTDDPSVYSVDPSRIREALADMKELAPADEYGIVFWSHSNGWLGPVKADDTRYRAFGDDRGHHITIPTLAETLEGEKFSFIYFDCCQMGNVETIWELRHLAPVIVASPTELGIEGMPYDLNAPLFFTPADRLPRELDTAARNTYEWYDARRADCQMTVIHTDALPVLAEATRAILATVSEYPKGISSLQHYTRPGETCWSYDMDHYMEHLAAETSPELLAAWRRALREAVSYKATTPEGIGNLTVDRYCGLGCHAPSRPSDLTYRQYDTLAWWRDVASTCPAYQTTD